MDMPAKYRQAGFEVYVKGDYEGFFTERDEAEEWADIVGGVVKRARDRRRVIYRGKRS